jgi:branched-chain amino acid transport system substrate-binding protein
MKVAFSASLALLMLFVTGVRPVSPAEAPYEINVILSFTGQGAFIGKTDHDMLVAYETMINKRGGIKGQPIHFVFGDDATSPQVAVQLANGLIAKNAPIILGPNITATCRAVMAVVTNGPLNFCLSPGVHPAKGSYTYSVSVAAGDTVGVDLRYFRDRGWKRIARLTSTDATGQDADDNYSRLIALPENKELTTVADEHFNVTDISVAAQMARIKAAQPQVVIIWCTGTPLATALRAFADTGVDVPVFISNSNITVAQAKQYAAFIPKQYYTSAPGFIVNLAPSPASKRAQADYFAAIGNAGIRNDYASGIAWDPAITVVDALRNLGTKATAQQLRDYIQHLSSFPGISGMYDFTDGSQRGLDEKSVLVMRYDPATENWNGVSAFGGAPRK